MYQVREEFSEKNVGDYLSANSIPYTITVQWMSRSDRPGATSQFTTVFVANLSDEDAMYLTLTFKGVVAIKLDK